MDITHPNPLDVSAVRDPGMQSLIILAASLGWNVHQKQNQPVVITARDGVQKRLPTNTSIRMGVFQSALSTILAHTDTEDHAPTPSLIDSIIAITKPSTEHGRRLRIAIGESPAQHRERIAAHAAEPKGPKEPEPLTQRIEFPVAPEQDAARAAVEVGEHGALVSREPFQATRQAQGERVHTYQSDVSFERIWSDGYRDYECMECGKAFPSPKGAGSHSQTHGRKADVPAWQRVRKAGLTETIVQRTLPPTPEPEAVESEPEPEVPAIDTDPLFVLGRITALVAPELIAERDALRAEVASLSAERDQLIANLQALKDLIGGL